MKKTTSWILITVVALFILFLIIGVFVKTLSSFKKATTPITYIKEYPRIISKLKKHSPEILSHFPEEVPVNVSEVNFYFSPGFLQADSCIELKFQATSEAFEVYYAKFRGIATKSDNGGSIPFYTDEINKSLLPQDYEIMYFQADPDNTPEHSPQYGVVINKEVEMIIFWARAVDVY